MQGSSRAGKSTRGQTCSIIRHVRSIIRTSALFNALRINSQMRGQVPCTPAGRHFKFHSSTHALHKHHHHNQNWCTKLDPEHGSRQSAGAHARGMARGTSAPRVRGICHLPALVAIVHLPADQKSRCNRVSSTTEMTTEDIFGTSSNLLLTGDISVCVGQWGGGDSMRRARVNKSDTVYSLQP